MPDGGVTEFFVWLAGEGAFEAGATELGSFILANTAAIATTLEVVASVAYLRDQQRKAQNAAKDAYNASLKDRYVMVRGTTEQRQIVLGRQRVSGPIAFIKSYGALNASLVFCAVLAAHECDAIETVYFNDDLLTLDGSGNVIGVSRTDDFSIAAATATVTIGSTPKAGSVTAKAYYGSTVTTLTVTSVTGTSVSVSGASSSATGLLRVTYTPDPCPYVATTDTDTVEVFTPSSTTETFTLSTTPLTTPFGGTVVAMQQNVVGGGFTGADNDETQVAVTGVSGASVSLDGLLVGNPVNINYRVRTQTSRARIRKYLGAAGQTADATMVSNLPGVWTSAHKATGLTYLVVELDYDPDTFPAGIPNVSAVVRGLKCYDPRTTTTAWSENPALLMRAYAIHPLGGRQSASAIDDAAISAAANICDASAGYVVGANTTWRPLYTAGYVARAHTRPADTLNELCQAMGGRWWFADGILKVKAGSYTSPVAAIDYSWLSDSAPVQIQPRRNRADVVNGITGSFCDQDRDYKILPFPKFSISSYVSDDGADLPLDVQMAAVGFAPQAQYLAACQIRRQRNGMVLKTACNLRAYTLEPGDNVTVTLPRFGFSSKVFEVLDTAWTLEGGIELTLQESDPSIWNLDPSYTATLISSGTTLPSPWVVQTVTNVACSSGTSELLPLSDGSVISSIRVTWDAITDAYALQSGGGVEVKFGLAVDDESKWRSVTCLPGVAQARLTPVSDNRIYIVKARAFSSTGKGLWSTPVAHKVIGKTEPPPDVQKFSLVTHHPGARTFFWDYPSAPVDTAGFSVRYIGGLSSAAWQSMVPLFDAGAGERSRDLNRPGDGEFTFAIKAVDTSGNESANAKYLYHNTSIGPVGQLLASVDCAADGWPGTKTNCAISAYFLEEPGTLTWDTIPTSWEAWGDWDGPTGGDISYQHTTTDLGSAQTVYLRTASLANGASITEYQSSTDGSTYTSWGGVPESSFSARYIRVRWTISGGHPILFQSAYNVFAT